YRVRLRDHARARYRGLPHQAAPGWAQQIRYHAVLSAGRPQSAGPRHLAIRPPPRHSAQHLRGGKAVPLQAQQRLRVVGLRIRRSHKLAWAGAAYANDRGAQYADGALSAGIAPALSAVGLKWCITPPDSAR